MEYFYDEQMQKMESLGIEKLPFEDCLCQVNICNRRCTVNWVPEITVLMSFKCDTCIQIDLWYFLGLGVVKLLFLIFTCFLKTFFSALRFLWHWNCYDYFQMLDLVRPKVSGKITLADLKNCKMANIFFDTFFNLDKFLDHEQRDPFANARVSRNP